MGDRLESNQLCATGPHSCTARAAPQPSCSASCWVPALAPMRREKTHFHPSLLSLSRSAGSRTGGAEGLWADWEAFWGRGPLGSEPLPPREPSCRLQDPAQERTPLKAPGPPHLPCPPPQVESRVLLWALRAECARDPRANYLVAPCAHLSLPGWRPSRMGQGPIAIYLKIRL